MPKKIKTILSLALALELFTMSGMPAAAGLFGGSGSVRAPSSSQIAAEIENRYHLNLESIQNQGENMNVADKKSMAPEVQLFFSPTDPKEGEKLTARAVPMLFTSTQEQLYYTWYLKHDECDLTDSPSDDEEAACDLDDDEEITENDWKIEAARLLVQNGYDDSGTSYSSDDDSDGYEARMGGNNQANAPNRCYVNDKDTGVNYELVDDVSEITFDCASGGQAVCVEASGTVSSGNVGTGTDDFFGGSTDGTCYVSGLPACSDSGPICNTGTPACVSDQTSNSCGTAISTCSTDGEQGANPICRHLFPDIPVSGEDSGDGSYGADEEEFWGSDPHDPDTADNGNKDEANSVGLGISSLTWTYLPGDEVGVVVEGTSIVPTKHNDQSRMIMWAFSKNDCPLSLADETGAYTKSIQNYRVEIEAAVMDLNECLERNLVDPTEGGQATRLDVQVTAEPQGAVNDASGDQTGDLVVAEATLGNAAGRLTNTLFDWRVELSSDPRCFTNRRICSVVDITDALQNRGLLGSSRSNGLNKISIKMDMPGSLVNDYLSNDTGYLRISTDVTEYFGAGATRGGRGDTLLKFISGEQKITAYRAGTDAGADGMRVTLEGNGSRVICNTSPLERNACPVIKNEIVGVVLNDDSFTNFNWTINGSPLTCNSFVSSSCSDAEARNINFFPVTGDPGDTYTVNVSATDSSTGKAVSLSRTFHVVTPAINIISTNEEAAWPKFLGQYRDISGATACPDGLCNDYSDSVFQGTGGSELGFRATFIPEFLDGLVPFSSREWQVDSAPVDAFADGTMSFSATKAAPGIYNVEVFAQFVQDDDSRRALYDIWNISQLESPEITFADAAQVETVSADLAKGENQQFLAAIASYIPASVLFALRMLLSGALLLFVAGVLFSFVPASRSRSAY